MSNSEDSRRAPSDRLTDYRKRRSAGGTAEPFGATGAARPRLFVVQKHAARRLHYDLRLEWSGTLWSWAVPNGPSLDPDDKRLAVHVEDHPVEYADFEGVVPAGNYGAGAVIVWDRGVWLPIDDPGEALATGKLHFELRGYKLRGEWILVRTGGRSRDREKEWLLFKKRDAWSRTGEEDRFDEGSILSGLTVEELRGGASRAAEIRAALAAAGAPRRAVDAQGVGLMHAETADRAFSSPEWIFELKYDGYRLLAARRDDGEPLLRSRRGHDLAAVFPDIARAIRSLPYEELVLDGELVILDETGRPDFHRLQRRSQLRRRRDVERATVELPATFYAFDLLGFEGFDLRPLPLARRKRLLRRLLPAAGPLRYTDHVEAQGDAMFERVREMQLEGIVAKQADAPYRAGRSPRWLKIVTERTGDFVVCGFTAPRGTRAGFGALRLGAYRHGELVYVGRVGSGFTDAQLTAYRADLEPMIRSGPPCTGVPSTSDEDRWVRPAWVAAIKFKSWTDDGLLRAPVFMRRRDDKPPNECVLEGAGALPEPSGELEPEATGEKDVRLTHLDKVFWPDEGYTKGDLVEYYRAVSPWLLPYLKDRPLVLTRYPDGITGNSFYQKNAPDFIPKWIRTEGIYSEGVEREIDYLVCDDLETLLYVANSASVPLHIWPSRVASIQHPDWCIIDLDPKGAPFAHVRTLARAVHELGEEIGLETFVKTSGSTGLHVLIPLGGACTFEQSRMLGQLIARIVEADHGEIATTARAIAARRGRVYLDYLQNRHGQLLVAPYSVRPLPGAPVSAPLEWREVNARLAAQRYTIRNLPARLRRKQRDPMLPLLEAKPDLVGALARLAERLERAGGEEWTA